MKRTHPVTVSLVSLFLHACGTSVTSDASVSDAASDASVDVPRDVASRFDPTPSTAPFGLISIEANDMRVAGLAMGKFDPLIDPMTSLEDIRPSGPDCVQWVEVRETYKQLVNVFAVSYQGLPEVTGQGLAAVPPRTWPIGDYQSDTWFRVTGFNTAWPRPFVTEVAAPPATPPSVVLPTFEPGEPFPTFNRNVPFVGRWDANGSTDDTHVEVDFSVLRGSDIYYRLRCTAPARRGMLSVSLWDHEPWFSIPSGSTQFAIEASFFAVRRRIEQTPDGVPVVVQSRRYLDGRVFRFFRP